MYGLHGKLVRLLAQANLLVQAVGRTSLLRTQSVSGKLQIRNVL